MGPYAGVDYNLTFCRRQSRLQHIYHRQPYARVDFIPQSGDLAYGVPIQNTQYTVAIGKKILKIGKYNDLWYPCLQNKFLTSYGWRELHNNFETWK
jgi:hypothetical protein